MELINNLSINFFPDFAYLISHGLLYFDVFALFNLIYKSSCMFKAKSFIYIECLNC